MPTEQPNDADILATNDIEIALDDADIHWWAFISNSLIFGLPA